MPRKISAYGLSIQFSYGKLDAYKLPIALRAIACKAKGKAILLRPSADYSLWGPPSPRLRRDFFEALAKKNYAAIGFKMLRSHIFLHKGEYGFFNPPSHSILRQAQD